MADVLDQIQRRQTQERNAELSRAQHDYDWNQTFGRMAPDDVLRETRNMTALIANAVEKKQQLLAQTNEEAQRIYINDQKFKAWQETQPLRDELLKSQIKDEDMSVKARMAQELLTKSRREREAQSLEHSALAQWEMDQLENTPVPEPEKRAWLNTLRGKYPSMDKEASGRFDALRGRLNPEEKVREAEELAAARARGSAVTDKTPAQIEEEAAARARGTASVKPEADTPELKFMERERKLYADALNKAKARRARADDPNIIADADADIREYEAKLTDTESQLRTMRGGTAPVASAAIPPTAIPVLTSKQEFDALPSGSQYLRDGKLYRKP